MRGTCVFSTLDNAPGSGNLEVAVGIFLEPHAGVVSTVLFPVQLHHRFLAFEGVNFSNDETSLGLKS